MTATLGLDAKAYYLDPAFAPRATWGDADANGVHIGVGPLGVDASAILEITAIKDVKFSAEKGASDVSTRGNDGWAAKLGTLKDASVDLTMVYDPEDVAVGLLTGSWIGGTSIALALLSGDATVDGTRGLWADFEVTKKDKDEPLTEGQIVTFTLQPSGSSSVAPEWIQVFNG